MKANRNFYFFCLALAVLLFVPNLLQKGMFVDGVWYAAISKNLAHGIGTFWQPVFTRTMFPGFYEHPPLVFGLQSLFFCALGDGIYVEKLYALVVIVLTLLLIHVLWKQIFREQKSLQAYSYLPIRITSYNVCYTKLLRFQSKRFDIAKLSGANPYGLSVQCRGLNWTYSKKHSPE